MGVTKQHLRLPHTMRQLIDDMSSNEPTFNFTKTPRSSLKSKIILINQLDYATRKSKPIFHFFRYFHLIFPTITLTFTTSTLARLLVISPPTTEYQTKFATFNSCHPLPSSFYSNKQSGGRGQPEMEGGRRGSRGGGRDGGTSNRIDALGRLLTRILRHMAEELNLDMRSDGYVRVEELLRLDLKTRANVPLRSHSIDEIREAVRNDNKQRFGLLEEDGQLYIRANQGHSVEVVETASLLRPITSAEDIPVCVHGTYKKSLDSILHSGLKRMSRLHVHFSSGLPSDNEVISGMRRDINVIIFLDVAKALEDGMKLYMSENKVILTEGFNGVVPSKYFQKIQLWPSRKPVPFQI